MTHRSSGFGPGLLAGGVVGFLLSAAFFRLQPPGFGIGDPWMPFFVVLIFITFWIVLVAVAIRWLFNPRGQQAARLADLPADFDDWHRRAHAQMDRESQERS